MPKIIQSPFTLWPGSIVLKDPLTLAEVELIEAERNKDLLDMDRPPLSMIDRHQIPAILACVEEWHIDNFPAPPTLTNWPLSPRLESRKFIQWIYGEIIDIYTGDIEIPNELRPTLTTMPAKADIPES